MQCAQNARLESTCSNRLEIAHCSRLFKMFISPGGGGQMLCIHDMYSHHSANDSSKLHGDFCIENVMVVIKCCAFTTCAATSACSYQTIAVNKGNYMVISAFNDIGPLTHRDLFSSHIAVSSCCHVCHGALLSVAVICNQGFLATKTGGTLWALL